MKASQINYGDYRQPRPEPDLSIFVTFEFLIRHLVSPSATLPKYFFFSIFLRTSALLRRNLNNGDKNVGGKQDALWINAIVALSDLGRGGLGGGGKYSFI